MLKVYYGDEPYGISYLIHKELAEGGYDEECIIKGPLTADILKDADSGGLFGEKFYILTTPELKGDVIEKLVAHEPASEVRIVADKVDKRTHVFTALTQRKAIKEVTRFGESDLKRFILRCLRGMKITESDFEYLVSKTGYGTVAAVNLYTVEKWCRQICSISPVITREAIDFCIPSECSEDGFKLFSFFIAKDKAGFFKLLLDLLDNGEDEMALLGTLLYQFRIAYKIALVGRKEAQFEVRITPWQINNVPESVSKDEALKNLLLITGAMRNIKFGSSAKNEIITVCSKLF